MDRIGYESRVFLPNMQLHFQIYFAVCVSQSKSKVLFGLQNRLCILESSSAFNLGG